MKKQPCLLSGDQSPHELQIGVPEDHESLERILLEVQIKLVFGDDLQVRDLPLGNKQKAIIDLLPKSQVELQ
jgi:hypothetical protein